MKEDYPLFQIGYAALKESFDLVERMPKWLRSSLSERLLNHTIDLLEAIVEAIYAPKKRETALSQVNADLEILRILWRISVEKRWISVGQYESIERKLEETGKMTGGWVKTLKS